MDLKGPPPPRPQFQRRILIIKRALQMKYVLLVLGAVVVTFAVVWLDVTYVLGRTLVPQFGGEQILPALKASAKLLSLHLSVYILVVALCAVFLSHKLAGPIFRLERIAEQVGSGDLTASMTLREGDELYETAETVNAMIRALRDKVLRNKTLADRIGARLEDLAARLESGQSKPAEVAAQLRDLVLEARHLGTDFKL